MVAGAVVTIGNFDGVHRGHRALLDRTVALARALGAPAAVLTFDPAPRDVLRPGNGVARIQSLARRLHDLRAAGVDRVEVLAFDAAMAAREPEDFARDVLGGARAIVVGHDFRFGRARRGDGDLLARTLGVPVEAVPALADAEGPISSSRVRRALAEGDVAAAAALLGRPHALVGEVVHGDARGRTIGFPTANLAPEGGLLPPDGVYAVRVASPGLAARGVANLGHRPTVGGTARRLEVHLFDVDADLYGQVLEVGLVARLREERRFPSLEALVAQIRLDAAAARAALA